MSLKQRSRKISQEQTSPAEAVTDNNQEESPKTPSSRRPPTLSQRAISQTLNTTANLANLLPTGTLLAFQLLTPIFTNNGACESVTRNLTLLLLFLLAFSCFLGCFTDSVKSTDGKVYYGFATFSGMYLFDYVPDYDNESSRSDLPDLRKYRIRLIDVIHGILTVLVFAAVALRDKNVLSCFYPAPEHGTQQVLSIVPIGIGVICSLLFAAFPTRRHGIGYPITAGQ